MTQCTQEPEIGPDVTLAIINARIWTGNTEEPWAEAVAICEDRICSVGSNETIEEILSPETHVLDAEGSFVMPGFIDSHVHFLEGGQRLASVQLRDAVTKEDFVNRIADYASSVPEGTWITGGDWDHSLWGGELPSRSWIDEATHNHPVWVNRLDGHMALANTVALSKAGLLQSSLPIEGGEIVRDKKGQPTGVLKDNAMTLVDRIIPPPSSNQLDRMLNAAMSHVSALGVTTVHHMGTWADLEVLRRAHRANHLRTRIYASVPLSSWQQLEREIDSFGRGDEWLRIGGVKGFVDGSLGSHTAYFFEPYTDSAGGHGLLVSSEADLYNWIRNADSAGLQVNVHAIGDQANSLLLDLYERVALENGPRDRRFRIEHAQHLAVPDIPRFAGLAVIASMQPYHAIDDGRWAETVIGPERIQTTYAFRSLLEAGARVAFGSDWFVAPPNPLEGIYAAVTRQTLDGSHPEGWVPEQKIGVDAALRAYTVDAAYAAFEEDFKGTVDVGKLADLVVIDRDLTEVPPEEIRKARILATVVGGKIIYERNS